MGFNAQIGENGSLLSAGERQRLGIARSLYADPSLLILDEPTANLDAAAEKSIWATLEQIKGQFTILIVSHRPAPETVYDNVLKLPIMK
jgi:ABC-type bacteriocin/lantibiotic exporter with double-glycine peptidase domain